jgi:agmatinase
MLDGDPHFPFGYDIYSKLAIIDYGDCVFDYGRPWEIAGHIREQAATILASGAHLFSLGGDHFCTWPLLQAHAERHGPLALVQFDAHQDTWNDDGERIDHGTFVSRAVKEGVIDAGRSIQIAIRTHAPQTYGIEIIDGNGIERLGINAVAERIRARVGDAKAYLTFDIDAIDPAFAPGTGTPVVGGLTTREARMILLQLGTIDLVGGDVVEVAPAYDVASITALAGATVAMTYLGLLAERRRTD